ncbi:hypothetical protein [Azospirillum griseum]|uniref:Uncharacterized protein n=1 Tax=Azospirillum griseum TaxID=2496639 RepID=A0A431VI50_9PROT|nr:hypothetical protein [Azospirillum griseum]RTR20560.1 hypothetical protein EJ903_10580 [Azospirillum griseum]
MILLTLPCFGDSVLHKPDAEAQSLGGKPVQERFSATSVFFVLNTMHPRRQTVKTKSARVIVFQTDSKKKKPPQQWAGVSITNHIG